MDKELMAQFSAEELAAMGETTPEPTPDPGTPEPKPGEPTPEPEPKPEPTPEPTEPEKKDGEPGPEPEPEEGKPVPYDRFKKVYGQAKQTEREKAELAEKLDLFKRNPEEYFAKYPDERPADFKPAAAKAEPSAPPKVRTFKEMLGSRVNDPQQPSFHGKTLADLLQGTPEEVAAAHDYYSEYVESVKGQAQAAKAKDDALLSEMQREDNAFQDARATELFGKPMAEIDATQRGQVEKIVKDTLAWMTANNRLGYKLADAYKVRTYDDAIRTAGERGAKALVDRAKSGVVRSVAAGPSGEKSSDPYAAYLAMSEDALMDRIQGMPEAEYVRFLTNATPAFRQKFPALPYTM